MSPSFWMNMSMWSDRAPSTVISPPARATAASSVAASMRSGMTVWSTARQLLDPLDLDRRRAGAHDHGPHPVEEGGQVGDLGLPGRVLDHRRALGQHRGQQQVLRRADARELEHDARPEQLVGPGLDVAVVESELRAHLLEAGQVHVDRA